MLFYLHTVWPDWIIFVWPWQKFSYKSSQNNWELLGLFKSKLLWALWKKWATIIPTSGRTTQLTCNPWIRNEMTTIGKGLLLAKYLISKCFGLFWTFHVSLVILSNILQGFGVVVVVAKNVNNSIVLDCAKQFRTFHFSVQRQSTIPSYLGTALSKVTHPNHDWRQSLICFASRKVYLI